MRDVVEEIEAGWRIPLAGFVAEAAHEGFNAQLRVVREGAEALILVPDDMFQRSGHSRLRELTRTGRFAAPARSR